MIYSRCVDVTHTGRLTGITHWSSSQHRDAIAELLAAVGIVGRAEMFFRPEGGLWRNSRCRTIPPQSAMIAPAARLLNANKATPSDAARRDFGHFQPAAITTAPVPAVT